MRSISPFSTRDSTVNAALLRRQDSLGVIGRGMLGFNAGTLVSGIASISGSLDAYTKGQLATYNQAIAMTKVDGWRP